MPEAVYRAVRLERFQEKWVPVFRPETRQNKELDRVRDSKKSGNDLSYDGRSGASRSGRFTYSTIRTAPRAALVAKAA